LPLFSLLVSFSYIFCGKYFRGSVGGRMFGQKGDYSRQQTFIKQFAKLVKKEIIIM
jgi:hypothetical protein